MTNDRVGVEGSRTREHGAEVWTDAPPPGGWVCAICGTPTESEPCDEHYPEIGDKRTHQWKRFGKPEHGTLCGQKARHDLFPKFQIVNIDANPAAVTCGDCNYLMQKIEGANETGRTIP